MLDKGIQTHLKQVSLKPVMAHDILFFHIYVAFKQKSYSLHGLNLKGSSSSFCVFWLWSHALLLTRVHLWEL